MKNKHFLLFIALAFVGVSLNAQTLDEAILNAAVQIVRELPGNSRAAVINFRSNSERLNDYVVNELYGAILRNRRVTPVRPTQNQVFDIYRELGAGEINREAAQNIAQLLGVQYLITGSIEQIRSDYRIHFNAVNTVAEVQSGYSVTLNLQNDSQFANLFSGAPAGSPSITQREPATGGQPSVVMDNYRINRDRRKKWVYVGGPMWGFANVTRETLVERYEGQNWIYESNEIVSFNEFATGFQFEIIPFDIVLTPYFAIELAVELDVFVSYVFAFPVLGKLGLRFGRVGLSFNTGYGIGSIDLYNATGFALGGTFGIQLYPGVLFFEVLSFPSLPGEKISDYNSSFSREYSWVDSATFFFLGYKFGIGPYRERPYNRNR